MPGPLFANIVLADEINRATPKTQSALLEAMSERKVSVERKRYSIPEPFVVLATQNPLEHHGTFPLPESQLDRFLMALSLGYPPRADERELLLSGGVEDLLEGLQPVLSREGLLEPPGPGGPGARGRQARGLHAFARRSHPPWRRFPPRRLDPRGSSRCSGPARRSRCARGGALPFRTTCSGWLLPVLAHRIVLKRGAADLEQSRKAIERVVAATPVPL